MKTRILLVEDEVLIRTILAETLSDEGFEVVEAADGEDAVQLLNGPDGFAAVVTDIHMPGDLDGLDVGRHARARHPEMPVVYVTGRPDALQGMGALRGRDALLRKPVLPSEVVRTIRTCVTPPGDGRSAPRAFGR